MAELTAELALEVSKFRKSLKDAQAMTGRFQRNAAQQGKRMGGNLFGGVAKAAEAAAKAAAVSFAAIAAAGVGAGYKITQGLKSAFDLGGRLSDVAARIGDSAGAAQILETMFAQTGVGADKVADTVQKMQRSVIEAGEGLTTYQRAFDALGLDYEKLGEMGGVEAFTEIAAAIGKLDSAAEKSARAMQIFGRSGGQLLALFADPEALEKATSMVGAQAGLLSQHANEFDRVSDIWRGLGTKIQGAFVGMGSKLIQHVLPFFEYLNKIDLAPIGEKFGASLARAIDFARAAFEVLGTGDIMLLIGESLKIAFKEAIAVLYRGFSNVVSAVLQKLAILTTGEFWKGMGNALLAIAGSFALAMLDGTRKVIVAMQDIPGLEKASKTAAEKLQNIITPLYESTRENLNNAGPVKSLFDIGDDILRGRLFDTSGNQARLAEILKKVNDQVGKLSPLPAAAGNPKQEFVLPPGEEQPATPAAAGLAAAKVVAQSMRRIGGGGRVAGIDNQLRIAQQQLDTQRKTEAHLAKLTKQRTNSPTAVFA